MVPLLGRGNVIVHAALENAAAQSQSVRAVDGGNLSGGPKTRLAANAWLQRLNRLNDQALVRGSVPSLNHTLVAQTVEAAGLDPARWGFESLREYSSSSRLVVWISGSHPEGQGSIPCWRTCLTSSMEEHRLETPGNVVRFHGLAL